MKKHKKLSLLGMLLALVMVLAACGGGDTASTEASTSAGSGDGSSEPIKLTLYSNSLSDERNPWLDEKATEAGFDLEFVSAGGGEIYNRVLAEKNAPIADVVFGLDESMFFSLEDEGILVPYDVTWKDEMPEDALIGDGYFYPLVEQRIFLIYNPEYIKDGDVPTKWEDLAANPNLHGKYKLPPNTTRGTNQKSVLSILLQYQDPNGELGISQEGWDQVKAFFDNGYNLPEGEDAFQDMADGSVPINFHFISGIPAEEEKVGIKVKPVNPDYGVIVMREQIGIVNKGDDVNYDNAKKFVEWFGSAEVQGAWAKEFGSLPVSKVAFESASDRVKELAQETTPMKIDWNFVKLHLNDWMEKVELEMRTQ